jgi:hypothetical protein
MISVKTGNSYPSGLYIYNGSDHIYEPGDLVIYENLVYKCILSPGVKGIKPKYMEDGNLVYNVMYFRSLHDLGLDSSNKFINNLEEYLHLSGGDKLVSSSALESIINYHFSGVYESIDLTNQNIDLVTRPGIYISGDLMNARYLEVPGQAPSSISYLKVTKDSNNHIIQETLTESFYACRKSNLQNLNGVTGLWDDWNILFLDTDQGRFHNRYVNHVNQIITTCNSLMDNLYNKVPSIQVVNMGNQVDLDYFTTNALNKLSVLFFRKVNGVQYNKEIFYEGQDLNQLKSSPSDELLKGIIYGD